MIKKFEEIVLTDYQGCSILVGVKGKPVELQQVFVNEKMNMSFCVINKSERRDRSG